MSISESADLLPSFIPGRMSEPDGVADRDRPVGFGPPAGPAIARRGGRGKPRRGLGRTFDRRVCSQEFAHAAELRLGSESWQAGLKTLPDTFERGKEVSSLSQAHEADPWPGSRQSICRVARWMRLVDHFTI